MFKKVARVLGADPQKKQLEPYAAAVQHINALEKEKFAQLNDEELGNQTQQFRARLTAGETLEDLLPEAFAAVREASIRTIGLRHYDVQLIGGMVLHEGKIAEMRTGEGKTLAATLPLYLNALTGKGAHLVTVNDYLARRDARWMAPIFHALGMSVGVLQMSSRGEDVHNAYLVDLNLTSTREDQHQLKSVYRRDAYLADITYGTNSEFGFDYLRDNLTRSMADRVQRGHHYAIVDEVDNILIDEARTPLIISGPAADESQWYQRMAQVVRQLQAEDYEFNEKDRSVAISEAGILHVEEILGIPLRDLDRPEDISIEQARILGYLEQLLKAKLLFKKNKDYIIQSGQVIIVDEFTGRLMPGRRWSEGLHQAIEALENVKIHPENITYATITLQNYFRKYTKLAGMTGTALTEAEEFYSIYKLDVMPIPTNLDFSASQADAELILLSGKDEQGYAYNYYARRDDGERKEIFWKRKDYPDVVYRTTEAKLRAITQEILRYHIQGRPLLIGTSSVEHSELLAARLKAPPLRRLLQTLILQDAWLKAHHQDFFERVVPELVFLNEPLEKINPSEMQKLAHSLGVSSLNVDDHEMQLHLLSILKLGEEHLPRFQSTLQRGIEHSILNARNHTEESKIIANAGAYGSVMIATNMAGRGIDIKLGGDLHEEVMRDVIRILKRSGSDPFHKSLDEIYSSLRAMPSQQYGIYEERARQFMDYYEKMKLVRELGGLHVIGSERHEARRIDNQLRGRSARQGDPGSTRFYLSLEDDLLRLFGQERREGLMKLLNYNDLMPLEHNLIGRLVEQSQERVEGYNFDIRKHLLEYDDVLNSQREKIYAERDKALTKVDLREDVLEMLHTELERRIPLALQEPDGTWKLLAYLEEIQPSMYFEQVNLRLPSFTMRILLDYLRQLVGGDGKIKVEKINQHVFEIVRHALEAEKTHQLNSAAVLMDRATASFEEQLKTRMEEVDIYFDALSTQLEGGDFNPRSIVNDISKTFNIRLDLSHDQIQGLSSSSEEIHSAVSKHVRNELVKSLLVRIGKTFGRRLEDEIHVTSIGEGEDDWESAKKIILNAITVSMQKRIDSLCGAEGQTKKNIQVILKDRESIEWQANLGQELLENGGVVSRMTIHPKSRQPVTKKTNLVNYIFLAGGMLVNQDPDKLTSYVLQHLNKTLEDLRMIYGYGEMSRIFQPMVHFEQLEPGIQKIIHEVIGKETFEALKLKTDSQQDNGRLKSLQQKLGGESQNSIFRGILLNTISQLWIEHLTHMEALRVSIRMEAYAQKDPLVQYKSEATDAFKSLLDTIRMGVIHQMFRTTPSRQKPVQTAHAAVKESVSEREPAGFSRSKKKHKKHRHH
jgi:preprotein translocase subunit SecA